MKNRIDAETVRSFDDRMYDIYKERNALDMSRLYTAEKEKEFDSREEALDKEFKELLFSNSSLSEVPNGRVIFDDLFSKAVDKSEALYDGEFQDIYDCFVFFEEIVEKALVLTGTIQ